MARFDKVKAEFGAKCTDGVELGKWEIINQIPQTLADLKISYFSFQHQAKLRPHLDLQNKDHHIHPTDLEFPKGTGRSRTRNWEHCNGERTIKMVAALRTRAQADWGKREEWNSLLGAMAP